MLKGLFRQVNQLLRRSGKVDEALLAELEELLVASDISVGTTAHLMASLRQQIKEQRVSQAEEVRSLLKESLAELLSRHATPLAQVESQPMVYLMMGVNGTGKTTTIAKLAHRLQGQGKSVLLVASDTFRAAAIEQLETWGQRLGVDTVKGQMGGDPAAVVFDALQSAQVRGIDCVIIDTAGRLHTKRNLMEELKKINRVIERGLGRGPDETLLVLDATTGQNALVQAQQFAEAVGITGIVLAKLDGTAKGGTLITIAAETEIPIKLIGTGEKLEDLEDFQAQQFAESLFEGS